MSYFFDILPENHTFPENAVYNTSFYDFDSAGQSQELLFQFNPKPEEAAIQMAIEKGKTAPSSIKAEIESWTLEESLLP